jgi:NitT/TauT family transport system substrate-binding protein
MKRFLLGGIAALAMAGTARADNNITLQLKWVTQAQFAGYYVAQAKGFYKADGLNVTIKPGGPDVNPDQVLALGPRRAREGARHRQHRAGLPAFRHGTDLPQG